MKHLRFIAPAARNVLLPMARRLLTRRNVLRYGGGFNLVAGSLITVQAFRTGVWGTGPDYDPWLDWNPDRSPTLMPVVRAGILASNNHTTQPWRFAVRRRSLLLYADTNRALGNYDPFMRELWISLGCVIENMDIAARAQGFTPAMQYSQGRLPARPLTTSHWRPSSTSPNRASES